MSVNIDPTGHHILPRRVDDLVGLELVVPPQKSSDFAVLDEDVCLHLIDGSDDSSVLDECSTHWFPS